MSDKNSGRGKERNFFLRDIQGSAKAEYEKERKKEKEIEHEEIEKYAHRKGIK